MFVAVLQWSDSVLNTVTPRRSYYVETRHWSNWSRGGQRTGALLVSFL